MNGALSKLFRWETGRQQTGYKKMLLSTLSWPIKFDMYLLEFGEGHKIPPHQDQVEAGRHYRLNIILKHPKQGGDFICKNSLFESRSIKLFRPDISEHEVTKIISGSRLVFSLGWIRA